jgi:hypothetical protein
VRYHDDLGPRKPFLRPALRDTFRGYFDPLTQRVPMSRVNCRCGATVVFDETKQQAADPKAAPITVETLARINEKRAEQERLAATAEQLLEQHRGIESLLRTTQERISVLGNEIADLVPFRYGNFC